MAHGTYLTRNRHSSNWYARIVIPHDLRHAYDRKREIRRTLETPCKLIARRRALLLWLAYQQVFESLRNDLPVDNLSPYWGALAFLVTEPSPDAQISTASEYSPVFSRILPLTAIGQDGERFVVSFVTINAVTGEITLDKPTEAELEGAERLLRVWGQGMRHVSHPTAPGGS